MSYTNSMAEPTTEEKKHDQDKIALVLDSNASKGAKNIDGSKGEKCNNCGGFGYTLGLRGEKLSCKECDGEGVKLLTRKELQNQVFDLKQDLKHLKQALIETIGTHGLKIKTEVNNTKQV